ncbi:MAG: hypothetical protein OJF49_003416 [Ktedonobacterales bacterium]|nr:MAG: hypothetical protein OJF49_003416 [Ktedonobacterales bacterium]
MHPYIAETLMHQHTASLLHEAERERLLADLPRSPALRHWLAAQLGLLLIRGGKRLTHYAYTSLAWR